MCASSVGQKVKAGRTPPSRFVIGSAALAHWAIATAYDDQELSNMFRDASQGHRLKRIMWGSHVMRWGRAKLLGVSLGLFGVGFAPLSFCLLGTVLVGLLGCGHAGLVWGHAGVAQVPNGVYY